MKNALLLSVGLLALGMSAPAFAADLAARPAYTKAPVMAPAYDWSGFYIGANAGGGSSHNCWDITNFEGTPLSPALSDGCHNATGALVGGQLGYRWQLSNWVFGVEAQGNWANLKGSSSSGVILPGAISNQTKIDSLGLFTGQVGYAWNNVLWYAKGGAAITHDNYSGVLNLPDGDLGPGSTLDSANGTRWGGVVGTGIEIGFGPNWSIGVEYDHLFMGNHNVDLVASPVVGGGSFRSYNIRQDVDMGTVRLNYRFGGPTAARY